MRRFWLPSLQRSPSSTPEYWSEIRPNDRTSPEASEMRSKLTSTQGLFVGAQRSTARFAPRFVSNGAEMRTRAAESAASAASRAAMGFAGFGADAPPCVQPAEVVFSEPRTV